MYKVQQTPVKSPSFSIITTHHSLRPTKETIEPRTMQSKSLFAVVLSPAMALALPTEPEPEPAVFACTAPSYLACCEDIIAGVGVDIPTALATGCKLTNGG